MAQLADRLIQNGMAQDMATAISMVYSSPIYSLLEQEKTKYWWLGVNALFFDLAEGAKTKRIWENAKKITFALQKRGEKRWKEGEKKPERNVYLFLKQKKYNYLQIIVQFF